MATKTMYMKIIILGLALAISLLLPNHARSQSLIDRTAPPFNLKVHQGLSGRTALRSPRDYRGKWLVLDFWSKTCVACIAAFPKMDSLRQQYQGRINFLLIGLNDRRYNQGIEAIYHKTAKALGLQLDHAFDSTLVASYQIRSFPNVVLVDPKGMVRAVTLTSELNPANLDQLLAFDQVAQFALHPSASATKPENRSNLVAEGPLAHHSSLAHWQARDYVMNETNLEKFRKGSFSTRSNSLESLFQLAYLGISKWSPKDSISRTHSPQPLIEVADKTPFITHFEREIGFYNYRIQMDSLAGREQLMMALQQDLKAWFGMRAYFRERETAVYLLRVTDPKRVSKLKSSAGRPNFKGDHGGYILKGADMAALLQKIGYYHPKAILIDETKLDFPIDLEINAPMLSLEEINAELQRQGLILERSRKPMKFLVITDKP